MLCCCLICWTNGWIEAAAPQAALAYRAGLRQGWGAHPGRCARLPCCATPACCAPPPPPSWRRSGSTGGCRRICMASAAPPPPAAPRGRVSHNSAGRKALSASSPVLGPMPQPRCGALEVEELTPLLPRNDVDCGSSAVANPRQQQRRQRSPLAAAPAAAPAQRRARRPTRRCRPPPAIQGPHRK